jgi:shikimate dehydrogenase
VTVSGGTKIVGIFGDPVEHSRSPAMHNAAFAALRLDYVYVPFRVAPADLRAAVGALRPLRLVGVNLTVPHKERALPLLDSLSPRAERIGAVNTIVNRDGHLFGDNTDAVGFLRAVRAAGVRARSAKAIVVGAGGAARSIVVALAEAGAAAVHVVNRRPQRARRLARALWRGDTTVEVAGLDALADAALLGDAVLVVNTTPLGWKGERFPEIAYGATRPTCLFCDLVYGVPTDFLRRARRARRRTMDGSEMLLHQGASAFSLWTGRSAPLSVMRAALRSAKISN